MQPRTLHQNATFTF